MNLHFDSNIVNLLLKTNVEKRRPDVFILECFNCR